MTALLPSVLLMAALLLTSGSHAYQDDGTRTARVWPPITGDFTQGTATASIDPCSFKFVDDSASPSAVSTAIQMYQSIIFYGNPCSSATTFAPSSAAAPATLTGLTISATHAEPGVAAKEEGYSLDIPTSGMAMLNATSYEGVLRGLETFSQLVLYAALQPNGQPTWHIANTPLKAIDQPDFSHRGLLIDVARTFLPVSVIENIIDGLMYSKMNVLHIHLTDSQSFPVQLQKNPEITFYGAFSADKVYSQQDLRNIVAYGLQRGVRVYPEMDSPGHTRALGLAPSLSDIVSCANVADWGTCCNEPPCGQLNIASTHMMDVLRNVTQELTSLFDDEYFHVGYDEINFNCWAQDASIQAYLKTHNMTINELLLQFFNQQVEMVKQVAPGKSLVFWEEVTKQTPMLPVDESSTIQVWGEADTLLHVLNVTKSNVIISVSDDYYLDCGLGNMFGASSWCDPFKTWWHMYSNDFLANVSSSDTSRIVGGEACNWGETSGAENSLVRIFPRAPAYAARLWNYKNPVSQQEANLRIADHAERLSRRGLAVDGTTLQYCRLFPNMCYNFLDNDLE
eukprot:m.74253 g.74253  ORF g.74253 m.74253 type:complete len:567 (-) comp13931_c3_seq1:332-2032(-)